MKRRAFCRALAALALAFSLAKAQPGRMLRVAWVSVERKNSPSPNLDAFRGGMRDLGYVEGGNLVIDTWWGEGSEARVAQLVGDILRSQPDIIVAQGIALFPIVDAGVKTPIVFSISADPVEAKVVESFARPGRNVTGISLFTLALVGKRLQLLREAMPGIKRVALIANPQHPGQQKERDAAQEAAAQLGMSVRYFPVSSEVELDAALKDIALARDEAILAFADGFTMGFAQRIAAFSVQHGIPAIDGWAPFARQGNLLVYGPVIGDAYPVGHLRRQDSQGRKTRRIARRAADESGTRRQPQNREGARHHDPTIAAAARGRGDSVIDRPS